MKKLIILTSLLIFICIPVFAWNERAAEISLDYLNSSISPHVSTFMKSLNRDNAEIKRIQNDYKHNPKSIKNKNIYNFVLACKKRNQSFLNVYENRYFKPAYKKYLEIDKSISYEFWKHSVALSEMSLFYGFYRLTEINFEDCQKIYKYSK